ncbi:hypothetical protein [Shewanella sp. NIFS-20-20]|uniref:hypothetical protein n=1 Tax=Shewanella sp. NIFS-20-20 TaxID=2853806 RepID=UPI001C437DC6|nr:hypothetical protein [Shewanella sp. NIFS-20-20]MBV7316027.1 hypothetical protein [Shewanella sp. NIFS-20-20]
MTTSWLVRALLVCTLSSGLVSAADAPPLNATHPLPRDGARDAEGNPIAIPSMPPNLVMPATQAPPARQETPTKRRQSSAAHVANDPSCRWLNSRIKQLSDKRQRHGHQDTELNARQQEWQCLDCAGQGPKSGDHDRCLYRR